MDSPLHEKRVYSSSFSTKECVCTLLFRVSFLCGIIYNYHSPSGPLPTLKVQSMGEQLVSSKQGLLPPPSSTSDAHQRAHTLPRVRLRKRFVLLYFVDLQRLRHALYVIWPGNYLRERLA